MKDNPPGTKNQNKRNQRPNQEWTIQRHMHHWGNDTEQNQTKQNKTKIQHRRLK